MKKVAFVIFYLLTVNTFAFAGNDTVLVRKGYTIERAVKSPKVDGILDDDAWQNIITICDLKQCYPYYDKSSSQKTEVKMVYDNTAIYIGAMLYDSSPDSIAHQLGNRDDDLNADNFEIVFDTYNKEQDAFDFIVTASGVQLDSRFSDQLYNAVWESAVKINDKGWAVEIKIPYSALRFPNMETQLWGFQVTRFITRKGELDQWGMVPRGESNSIKFWGFLKGLTGIKEPVRLSVSPYLTLSESHYPANIRGESNYSSNITGGLDLKYGINESFTVDATLLPDFSQVQSDNVVKNLSAFEVTYSDQRPFFQESTDLFQKGDLFYSRRIGRRPSGYYNIYRDTSKNKIVIKNPDQAKLLNATKLSGRTTNGLGVGILNAVMDNTYATVRDSLGNIHKILTEPFSNYNIVVFDQQLQHGSNVYLINTNVNRKHDYNNSNATGAGFSLNNKKSTYNVNGSGALTNVFSKTDTVQNQYSDLYGYKYDVGFSKTTGWFQYGVYREVVNKTFNNNDMGITRETNYAQNGFSLNFMKFKPFGKFLNANANISIGENENLTTHRINSVYVNLFAGANTKAQHNIYLGAELEPADRIDYYEARTPGRIFVRPPGYRGYAGINTDPRKKLRISFRFYLGTTALISPTIGYNPYYGVTLSPTIRATDKLSFDLSSGITKDNGDRGYVDTDEWGTIIFGVRYLTNLTNSLAIRYLFRNNLSLSLRGRHYWARGDYRSFYDLTADGHLIDNISYNKNHDFNFNAFNIDMVFQWQFAPGSSLNLVWKNSIYTDGDKVINSYSENFRNTINSKQLNIVSLKVLYYFDYLYLVKKRNKN